LHRMRVACTTTSTTARNAKQRSLVTRNSEVEMEESGEREREMKERTYKRKRQGQCSHRGDGHSKTLSR
jgi:hypothetical protein